MNRIYNEIANSHCVTSEEIKKEINLALAQAKNNTSPTAKAFWGSVEDSDTLEDIICKIVSRVALVV